MGHATVDSLSRAIRNGASVVPPVDRKQRIPSAFSGFQASKVDAWFLQLHKSLGETMPDADNDMLVLDAEEIEVLLGCCILVVLPVAFDTNRKTEVV